MEFVLLVTQHGLLCKATPRGKQETTKTYFLVFCDLEEAFDSVPSTALWKVLHRYRCLNQFISLVQAVHVNMPGRVFHQNTPSEEFPIPCKLKKRMPFGTSLIFIVSGCNASRNSS